MSNSRSHAIGPGHELRDVARADRAVGTHIGAHVGVGMAAQPEDGAVALAGDFDIDLRLAGVVHGHQVLAPVLDPLHRTVAETRGKWNEEILRIEFAARAEAAADIVLHHLDGFLRQADLAGEDAAVEERHLGGAVHRQPAGAGVPFGHDAARLHGEPEVALHAEGFAPGIRRIGKSRIGVAAHRVERERAVGAGAFEQQAFASLGNAPVGDRGQRLDLRRDRLQRVFADGDAVREHHGHRLSDIAHLAVGNHRLLERFELRQRLQPHRDDRSAAGHVARRDDCMHSRNLQSLGGIDGHNASVSHGAAQDDRMQQAFAAEVVDVFAAAAQEAQVFPPLDAAADEGILHRPVSDFLYAARASSTASTIGM
jgi:hypothetical protein